MEDYETYLAEKGFSAHTVDSYLFAVRQLSDRVGCEPSNESLMEHKDWLAAHFAHSASRRYRFRDAPISCARPADGLSRMAPIATSPPRASSRSPSTNGW